MNANKQDSGNPKVDQAAPASPSSGRATALLQRWQEGDEEAFDELLEELYGELRQLAAVFLSKERPSHTLQPTALVNEAYLKLLRAEPDSMHRREHFFAAASQAMRRVLVESARKLRATKRTPVIDPTAQRSSSPQDVELLDLDRALDELEQIEPHQARLVELRYFGGLTIHEASTVMERSTASLQRDWQVARLWLRHRLAALAGSEEPLPLTTEPPALDE